MSDSRPAVWCALALLLGSAGAVAQDEPAWRWSGEYRNLLLGSRTVLGERYGLDINRLRLALKGSIGEAVSFDLQYDNELLLGSYLRTSQFQQTKDVPPPQYWSAQSNYVDHQSLYGSHGLYRATFDIAAGATDIRIGRQRIAWGNGRFWSPLDLLNPVSPITLDRSERLGVDALLIEHKLGALSRVAAVVAPAHVRRNSSRALLWHDNVGGVDYSAVAGRFRDDEVLGADFAAPVGQAIVRGEWARVRPPQGAAYDRVLLGADHAFANTLTLSVEIYLDGSGAIAPSAYDVAALVGGRRQTLARRYLGLLARYEITPLLRWSGELVINLVDRSRYVAPSFTYSLRSDIELSLGLQSFTGSADSELARYPNVMHAQLKWYF